MFDLDSNQIITLLMSAYAAGLSTYLAIKGYINKQPRLNFMHKFETDKNGHYLEIYAQNSSERNITIHDVEYNLGKTKALRSVPIF